MQPPPRLFDAAISNFERARDCYRRAGLTDEWECLWRLGRFEEAERIFDRMLWLNPSDNQGVRFLIDPVRARAPWKDEQETS